MNFIQEMIYNHYFKKAVKELEKLTYTRSDGKIDKFSDYFYLEFKMSNDGSTKICNMRVLPCKLFENVGLFSIKFKCELNYSDKIDYLFEDNKMVNYYSIHCYDSMIDTFTREFKIRMSILDQFRQRYSEIEFLKNNYTFSYDTMDDENIYKRVINLQMTHIKPMDIDMIIKLYKANLPKADLEYLPEYRKYLIDQFAAGFAVVEAIMPEHSIMFYYDWLNNIHLPYIRRIELNKEFSGIIKEINEARTPNHANDKSNTK